MEEIRIVAENVKLHDALNSNISNKQKKELVADYIYTNFVPERLKGENASVTKEGLMETDAVNEIVRDNGDALFIALSGLGGLQGVTTNTYKQWFQANSKAFIDAGLQPQEVTSLAKALRKTFQIKQKNFANV